MNRRNIVQFKPEGVANIFAPTIRINGGSRAKNNKFKEAANAHQQSHVNYPQQQTITIQRQQMAQEAARQNNFDEVYQKLFGNLMSNEYSEDITNNLLSDVGAPIPSGVSRKNYEILASENLRDLVNCIEKGGNCIHRDKCEPHNKIGNCFGEDYTCCKDSSENTSNSPGQGRTSAAGGYSSGRITTDERGTESGDIGYLKWQTSSGGSIQRQTESNKKKSEDKQGNVRGVQSNYFGVSGSSSEDDPYFCDTFCKGGGYDFLTGEWTTRPCEGECAKCSGCGEDTENSYASPNSISKILFDNNRYTQAEFDRTRGEDKCFNLSEIDCHNDKNCFVCQSDYAGNNYSCKKHPVYGNIGVCDKKGASACVPLYKKGGKLMTDTVGPFRDIQPYQSSKDYYDVNSLKLEDDEGLSHILEYPNKCKGPIDAEYTYDERYQDAIKARGF